MRIALFDPFSGASGDMTLGALVDAGLSADALRSGLARLPFTGWSLEVERVSQHGITGTRCVVVAEEADSPRDWATIREMLEIAPLHPPVRDQAIAIFAKLAAAEAAVHGVPVDDVHFHEVGAVDSIVDIVGACIGLHALGVERVFSEPIATGSGWVKTEHGRLPAPAPATARLLAGASAPVANDPPGGDGPAGELLTPTGAAILATLAEFRRPSYAPTTVGYGFGRRELPWPNALRVWIGELEPGETDPEELLLETNIAAMNPQFTELLLERLFAAGAVDAWIAPITMKKGRPAMTVSVLCPANRRRALEDVLIEQSTTLGVRSRPVDRVKAGRRIETVATRWGDVRLKLRGWRGRVIDAAPEYDDCLSLARSAEVPIREIWNEAHRLGEVYVGQKWSSERAANLRIVTPE